MVRRLVVARATLDNMQQIQSSVRRVVEPFHPKKTDLEKALLEEIEACREQIWLCVGGKNNLDKSAEESSTSAKKGDDGTSTTSEMNGQSNRVDIEFRVNAMKVVNLRKELKKRNLETTGLKKQLQARLREAMFNESTEQQMRMAPSYSNSVKCENPLEEKKIETPSVEDISCNECNDVEGDNTKPMDMDQTTNIELKTKHVDVKCAVVKVHKGSASKKSSETPQELKVISIEDQPTKVNEATEEDLGLDSEKKLVVVASPRKKLEEGASNIKQYWKKLAKPASVVVVASPMKAPTLTQSAPQQKKSPIRMVVKTVQKILPRESDVSAHDLVIAESKSDLTDDDFDGPMSEFSEASAPIAPKQMSKTGSVRDLVSKIQNGSSSISATGTVGGSGSALSKNLQAKKEARLARMAEIRGKSKPVMPSKHALAPKEYASTLSSLNAVSAPAGLKKNKLAAQMREKAARTAMHKENVSSCANQTKTSTSSETGKRDLQSSVPSTGVMQPIISTTKQGFLKKQKVASPISTYEISDREESESDSSDSESENEKQKKKIPLWAQKANLLPALEQQYNGCIGGRKVDPDEIFQEVQTCDLEAIFGGKKSRYTRRTSSGNWTQDKVTTAEKLVYKRTMGFASQA